MQETQCPQCGEWLGVPPEFADRPIRCGACGRVIPPHERNASAPPSPPPPPYRGGPQFPDDDRPSPRPSGPRFPDRDDDRYDPPRRKGGGLWWVWLLLAVGGISCCGCCGLLGLVNALNQWKPHTAKDGAFTAEFPGDPVHTTEAFNWKDKDESPGTTQQYTAIQLATAQVFAVHYADMPKSMKQFRPKDEKLLELGLQDFKAGAPNFTEQSRTEVTVAGKYKGLDVEGTYTDPKHGMLSVYVRAVIVGDRVFVLIAAGKDKAKLTPQKDRFFNSFKPADPPEKEKGKPAEPKEK